MVAPTPEPATQAEPDGPIEARSIIHIGGPLNCKKCADRGQNRHVTPANDLYKRVRIDAGDQLGHFHFDVLAYFGKSWEEV